MSYRLEDQPEWAGPLSEDAEPGQPRPPAGQCPDPPGRSATRPAEAAERTMAAERPADLFKSAPPDATGDLMSFDNNATVITPLSWASPAIELGNRQWRKRMLPVGDVSYKGRTLHFTRDYMGKLAMPSDRAYDQIPFQLATRRTNTPTTRSGPGPDPGMELAEDGLYARPR